MSRSRNNRRPLIPSKTRRIEGRKHRKRYNGARIDPDNHPKRERPRDSAYERALWSYL